MTTETSSDSAGSSGTNITCCHSHDCCYSKAEMYGCNPRVLSYRFYAQRDKIKCVKSRDRCEKMVCECDQKAAGCFQKHLFTYNPQFKNLPVGDDFRYPAATDVWKASPASSARIRPPPRPSGARCSEKDTCRTDGSPGVSQPTYRTVGTDAGAS
ncbi:group IIF secretory phospholipase A2-like [Ahaetulla prasina]|uniref:group IIF secretory phospholipase A2-like n=1 Tax=Ahaetulla prasina TaxID=499056 RepID=UPI002647341D|nr:group IIF secretory phospholipase A2-like [Ahaetulla prasina]